MRDIKFKAWDIEGNCWIPQECLAIAAMPSADGNILTYEESENRWIYDDIPVHIVQYIGLKDKHGNDIYTDFIVKANAKDKPGWSVIGKVIYDAPEYCLETTDYKWPIASMVVLKDFEVIGNAHENPELLENS